MKPKSLAILVVAAGIAAGAAYFATRGDAKPSEKSERLASLLPALDSKVNDIASLTVTSASGVSTVEQADGKWKLKEKSGYPVDAAKVRELVLTLASLKDLSPRTALPDRYKSIGVEDVAPKSADTPAPDPAADPSAEQSRAILVSMADKDGKPLGAVIVGNTTYNTGGSQSVYVRKPGEATSYSAELGARRLDVPRQAINWVDAKVADIARDRVWAVDVMPRENADTDRIIVARDKPGEGAFALKNLPSGKELKNPGVVETVVSGLVQANFEDVAEVSKIDFDGAAGGKPGPTVRVRTGDGLIVDVATTEVNGKTWWKLAASPDPDPYKQTPPAPPAPPTPAPPAPAADGSTPPPAAEPTPPHPPAEPQPKRTADEVNKEVAELNAKWAAWAYAPASYKASAFNTKLSEQLKDPAPPTPPPAPGTVPSAPTLTPGLTPAPVEPKP